MRDHKQTPAQRQIGSLRGRDAKGVPKDERERETGSGAGAEEVATS